MEQSSTASTRVALALLAAAFALQVYQAATRPIGSDEAYLYDRFVRPTTRQVLAQELPNRDLLYALLEKRSIGVFHVSPFAVRLPSLLFGLLFLWSAMQLWPARVVVAAGVAAAFTVWWGGFTTATGMGGAAALLLLALTSVVKYLRNPGDNIRSLNFCGIALGLTIAARLEFWMAAVALAAVVLLVQRNWWTWTERLLIPGVVIAFLFLAIPASHAHAALESLPVLTREEAVELQSALSALQAATGGKPVNIGTSVEAEAVTNFFRAQHRVNTWERAGREVQTKSFDYYLLRKSDSDLVGQRRLAVVYQNSGFVVARQPN